MKKMEYDWLLCIVLFVLSILIGELAEVINFSFLGNDYIPGNFLTRTIPYMLLGRLIYRFYDRLAEIGNALPGGLIMLGLVLSAAEYAALYFSGKLGYTNHFIGFIPIALGACLKAVSADRGGRTNLFGLCASKMYKPMYYIFNPLYYILIIGGRFIFRSVQGYYYFELFAGLITAVLTFGGCFLYALLSVKRQERSYLKAEAEAEREREQEELYGE